jgi:hypothetical protein
VLPPQTPLLVHSTQLKVAMLQVGVEPPQSPLSRHPTHWWVAVLQTSWPLQSMSLVHSTQVFEVASHTSLLPHALASAVVHSTHWLPVVQAGALFGQLLASLGVQTTQLPAVVLHTVLPGHAALDEQPVHWCIATSHIGVPDGQSLFERHCTQLCVAGSHTAPPEQSVSAAQITQLLLAQAGMPIGHLLVLAAVQSTQLPDPVSHTLLEAHCASAVQGTQLLPEHTGVLPVHAPGDAVVHSTQTFPDEQAGVDPPHCAAEVHSTHAPELAQTPLGQLPPLHATQYVPLQIGVVPLHCALLEQAVHAGFPESFTQAPPLEQVWRTPPAHCVSPL